MTKRFYQYLCHENSMTFSIYELMTPLFLSKVEMLKIQIKNILRVECYDSFYDQIFNAILLILDQS